ncbi:hypothetical protein P7C70_g8065, partial [Phenoliferia sp. Uapishka_3]
MDGRVKGKRYATVLLPSPKTTTAHFERKKKSLQEDFKTDLSKKPQETRPHLSQKTTSPSPEIYKVREFRGKAGQRKKEMGKLADASTLSCSSQMAQSLLLRQLTLRERFELQAPFLPTDSPTTLYKPDQANFDLVGNMTTGNFGLRALPHKLERMPHWTVHIVSTCSGIRTFCQLGAKLVAIPPEHPALAHFPPGFVTHMIEGGAEMDVHGTGRTHVELYGMGVDLWNDSQVREDFLQVDFHGYASERLIEISVEGCGRLRARGLARLQELARRPGGLGITLEQQPARGNQGEDRLPSYSPATPAADPPPTYSPPTPAPSPAPSTTTGRERASTTADTPTSTERITEVGTPGVVTPLVAAAPPEASTSSLANPSRPQASQPESQGAHEQQPFGPPPELTARATAAARAKQTAAHAARRHKSPPGPTYRPPIALATNSGASTSAGNLGARQEHGTSKVDGQAGVSESRKRKSTSPRTNLRADTEELFNKSQKLRQTHDWRVENGPGGRTANDWRGQPPPHQTSQPTTPSRLPPHPASYPTTPTYLPPRPSNDTTHHQHHLNQNCRGNHQGERAGGNGASGSGRLTRFDQRGAGFDNRALNYGETYQPSAPQTQCRPVNAAINNPHLRNKTESRISAASGQDLGQQVRSYTTIGSGMKTHRNSSRQVVHGIPGLAPPPSPFN